MPYHEVADPAKLQGLLDAVLAVGSDLDLLGLLHRIVEAAAELVDARYGALAVLDPGGHGLSGFVHVGLDDHAARRIGHPPEGLGVLGLGLDATEPLRLVDLATHERSVGFPAGHPPMRTFLGVPVRVRDQAWGHLYLADKAHGAAFSEEDGRLIAALATAAGIAIDNARLQERNRELTLTEDRERIARDLHDTVVQRMFGVALSLKTAEGLTTEPAVADRLRAAITDLDDTIRQVRTTIFALEPPATARGGLRVRVLEVRTEAARSLGFEPELSFTGLVDLVPAHVGAETLATLREALSNVARHAAARHVGIEVAAVDTELRMDVTDDGRGMHRPDGAYPATAPGTGHGLANMAERAGALGGSFTVSERAGGGTRLAWRVPLG